MLQITRLDPASLSSHINELRIYLDKITREKQSPIKIHKLRYQIQQLEAYMQRPSSPATKAGASYAGQE